MQTKSSSHAATPEELTIRPLTLGHVIGDGAGEALAAAGAPSEERDVRHVRLEPVALRQGHDHAVGDVDGGLDHPTAVAANEVQMTLVRCDRMVCRGAVSEMGVGDEAELLEQRECDRRWRC